MDNINAKMESAAVDVVAHVIEKNLTDKEVSLMQAYLLSMVAFGKVIEPDGAISKIYFLLGQEENEKVKEAVQYMTKVFLDGRGDTKQ